MPVARRKLTPLPERTFEFAVRIVRLCDHLEEKTRVARRMGDQLLRSGTSIGANVEEAQAAETVADFIHKYMIALKEGRETAYWLRLIARVSMVPAGRISALMQEAEEIKLILGASVRTAKKTRRPPGSPATDPETEPRREVHFFVFP